MSRRRQWGEDSTVTIDLSAGSITLTLKGNVFDLSPDERKLVANLSDVLQKYRDGLIEPGRLGTVEAQHA